MLDSTRLNSHLHHGRSNLWAAIVAGGVVLICLFAGLGALGLVGPDEPRYVWIARAMAETGDWITPRLYGQPWFEKPVLYYWTAALGFRLNLQPELAARLPSAFAALAAAMAIGWLGWKHYGAEQNFRASSAFLAPLVFSTTVAAIGFSRAATPDMLFSAFITLAMACTSSTLIGRGALRGASNVAATTQAHEIIALALFGVCLGLAVVAKGPAAVVLAGGAIGLWALATSQWRPAFRLAHPIAIGSFCIAALPWYVLCAARNPDFIRVFIFQHNFERYLTPVFRHRQPFWFFGWIVLLAMLPWTVLLIPVAQEGLRLWREKSWGHSPGFFFACWALFPILFFSLSQSKLPGYILPSIPALALLFAVGALRAFRKSTLISLLVTAGVSIFWLTVAVSVLWRPRQLSRLDIDSHFVAVTCVIILSLVFVMLVAGARRNLSLVAVIGSLLVAASAEVANLRFLPALDPYLSARPHAAFLRGDLRPDRIFTFQLNRSWNYGLAFYFHREIPEWSPADHDAALVLTNQAGLDQIIQAGRFRGELNQAEPGILYVPVTQLPR
jgi:4-amino-4-deoxy-L-arabinose transferase-like glycosyltransferase